MINEKAPCPKCNTLIWVGIPDNYELKRIAITRHADGFVYNRMNCPQCGIEIAVWADKKK